MQKQKALEAILAQVVSNNTNTKPSIISSHNEKNELLIKNAIAQAECQAFKKAILQLQNEQVILVKDCGDNEQTKIRRCDPISVIVDQVALLPLCQRLRSCLSSKINLNGVVLASPGNELSNHFQIYQVDDNALSSSAPHINLSRRDRQHENHAKKNSNDLVSYYTILFYLNVEEYDCTTATPTTLFGDKIKQNYLQDDSPPRVGDAICIPHRNFSNYTSLPFVEVLLPCNKNKILILQTDILVCIPQQPVNKINRQLSNTSTTTIINKKQQMEEIIAKAINEINSTLIQFSKGSILILKETNGVEMRCKAADNIFWSIYRTQQQEQTQKTRKKGPKEGAELTIEITSNYGLQQTYTRRKLAETIINYITQEDRSNTLAYISTISNSKSGMIFISTKKYTQERYHKDNLINCELCGKFVNIKNGLVWHLKNVHDVKTHEEAHDSFIRCSNAIMSYNPNLLSSSILVPEYLNSKQQSKKQIKNNNKLLDPPFEACRNGDVSSLKKYIENGWNPTKNYDKNGCSALLWAAGYGHLHICEYLVNECNIKVCQEVQRSKQKDGYSQRTALHWSSRNGHLHIVQWLIEQQHFPVDVESSDGTTALCLAAWQCHTQVCMYLVNKAGADPRIINSYGCNIVMWLAQSTCKDTKSILNLCQFLYDTCDVDFTLLNSNGQGCLHKAAQRGNVDLCHWLVETVLLRQLDGMKHFKPNLYEKSTPSQLARYEGYEDLANYLFSCEEKQQDKICNTK